MKSVLLIDAGNSRIKSALLKNDKLEKIFTFSSMIDFLSFYSNQSFSSAIYSSVLSESQTQTLRKGLHDCGGPVFSIKDLSKNKISSKYDLKKLGDDRLAKLIYAQLTMKKHCVVVDAGTALTIDFFAPPNQFLGGFITCGFTMEYAALSEKTKKLPFVLPGSKLLVRLPKNTEESIHQGVMEIKALGIRALIEKVLKKEKISPAQVSYLFTGGEARLLKSYFPEVQIEENLVLQGLKLLNRHSIL